MEGTAKELLGEEFQKFDYPAERLSCEYNKLGLKNVLRDLVSVAKLVKEDLTEVETDLKRKDAEDLSKKEEVLRARLNELKKENFSLQASINAWQLTLKNKLEEFKEADLKLNEIYNEIWSERENFCSETQKFNDEFGILSEWWERQMKFVSDLENLEKERLQDRKCQQEIDKLEKEIKEFKAEIQTGKQQVEVEVHSTQEADCFREERPETEVSSEGFDTKKMKSLPADDQTESAQPEINNVGNQLFSMLDPTRVRIANRNKHRRCKNHFLARVKNLSE